MKNEMRTLLAAAAFAIAGVATAQAADIAAMTGHVTKLNADSRTGLLHHHTRRLPCGGNDSARPDRPGRGRAVRDGVGGGAVGRGLSPARRGRGAGADRAQQRRRPPAHRQAERRRFRPVTSALGPEEARDFGMTTSLARQIALAARPNGRPQLTDFRMEETAIPTPASGQLLLAVQYLSLDPYMRGRMDDRKSYATPLQLGEVMTGESVAQVLTSNHPGYVEGDIVVALTGWRTHALSDGIGLYGTPFASSIQPLRRSRPVSACSACRGSLLMAVCG